MKLERLLGLKLAICLCLTPAFFNARAQAKPEPSIPVYFLGKDQAISERVFLDKKIQPVFQLEKAKVIVLQDTIPNEKEKEELIQQVRAGKGLIVMMGPEVSPLFLSELYGTPVELQTESKSLPAKFYLPTPKFWKGIWDYIRGKQSKTELHWTQQGQIDWSSLPSITDRFEPIKPAPFGKALVLGDKPEQVVLYEGEVGQGKVYLLTAWIYVDPNSSLSRKENKNYQFFCWPFFNYLVYGMVMEAGLETPEKFPDWPGAPVISHSQKTNILVGLIFFAAINMLLFLWVLTYSRRHKTPLEGFEKAVYTHDTFDLKASRLQNQWADAGFYRPLSGFLIGLIIGIPWALLMLPVGVWTRNNLYIFPMLGGMEGLIWGVLGLVFFVFDLDTSTAAIKFYAEYRVKDPKRAVQYFQFLIWWQMLTGMVQIIFITLFAFYVLPNTLWSYLAIAFFCWSLFQWPGFPAQFFYDVFHAYQRFDVSTYYNYINMALGIIYGVAMWYLWRRWGTVHPRFGEAFSYPFLVVTLFLAINWTYFFIGYFLYRRLGYPFKVMFMAHFNWELVKQVILYGYKLTIRQAIDKIDKFLWVVILAVVLSNYLENSGIVALALGAYAALEGVEIISISTFSEAYSNNRMKLARHYMLQALQWGFFGSTIIGTMLLIMVSPLNAYLSTQWSQVTKLLPLVFLSSILICFARMPDTIFKASGRTEFIPLVGAVLLAVKVIFLFLLVPSMQIFGPPTVLIFVNVTDVILSWLLISRYILKVNVNPIKMALPHLLAGAVVTLVLLAARHYLLPFKMPGLVAMVILTLLMMVPLIFLTAVFGGWNDVSLDEFERASLTNKMTRVVWFNVVKLIKIGRSYRFLPEYQPENREEIQAEADQIVVARIPEELRQTATITLSTMGPWKKSQPLEEAKKSD